MHSPFWNFLQILSCKSRKKKAIRFKLVIFQAGTFWKKKRPISSCHSKETPCFNIFASISLVFLNVFRVAAKPCETLGQDFQFPTAQWQTHKRWFKHRVVLIFRNSWNMLPGYATRCTCNIQQTSTNIIYIVCDLYKIKSIRSRSRPEAVPQKIKSWCLSRNSDVIFQLDTPGEMIQNIDCWALFARHFVLDKLGDSRNWSWSVVALQAAG